MASIEDILRSHGSFVEARCPDGAAIRVDMDLAAEEIERLRAIVDKLPKTADGVIVAAGDLVWHPKCSSAPCRVDGIAQAGFFNVKDCYSTKEAAEAAGEDQ